MSDTKSALSETGHDVLSDASGLTRARQAGVLLFGKILSSLGEAVAPILLVRLLDKADVGVLTATMLIYTTTALVLTGAFPTTIMYFLPLRDAPERRAIALRTVRILTALGGALAVLLAALGLWGWVLGGADATPGGQESSLFAPTTLVYLLALAPYPLGDLPSRLLPNLLVVEARPREAAVLGILKAVGTALFTLVPVMLGLPLFAVLASVSAFGLLNGFVLALFLRSLYRHVPKVPAPISSGKIIRFSIPLGITDIVGRLNSELDRFLVGGNFPAARFAEYRAAAWQVPLIKEIPYTVGRVDSPHMARLFEAGRPREALAIWRSSIEKVSLLVVPLAAVFVVAAEEVVTLLFTQEYVAAAPVFRLYSLLMLARVCAYGPVIVAAGKPAYVLQAAVFSLLSNVVLSIPALYAFGFIGPAVGTVVAFVPMTFFYCWCIARAAGVRITETFPLTSYLRVVVTTAVACIPAIAIKLHAGLGPAASLGACAVSILGAFAVLGSLTRQIRLEDWRFIGSWLRGGFARA